MSKREPHTGRTPKAIRLGQITTNSAVVTRNIVQVWSDGDGKIKDHSENGYATLKNNVCIALTPNCVTVCPVQALPRSQNRYREIRSHIVPVAVIAHGGLSFDVPKYDYDNPFGEISKCELCNQKVLNA